MQYFVVCLAAFISGAISLLAGFGVNVILLPVIALYFPAHSAFTGVVVIQLSNNLVKAALVGRRAQWLMVLLFGLPAALGGLMGQIGIGYVAEIRPITRYVLSGHNHLITVHEVAIAVLLCAAAVLVLARLPERLALNPRYQPLAGAIAGILGGLSGQDGALRGVVLVTAGLSPDAFIATSALAALALELSRLTVYGASYVLPGIAGYPEGQIPLLLAASLSAAAGSLVAARFRKSVPPRGMHILVGIMLLLAAISLGAGFP